MNDLEPAVRFYCNHLGFEVTYRWESDYASLDRGGSHLGLARRTGETPDKDFELWFYVDDVDADTERLQRAGARLLEPPRDMPWGERIAFLETPDGTLLHIGAKITS